MTQFIAHRGLSGHYPENTHLAFHKAWEADCDGIELDIQVSKDGRVVVIHDADTQRTAGEKLVVADSDYADLLRLNVAAGEWREHVEENNLCERIPLLTDVLADVPSGKLVQIEIKSEITDMEAVLAILATLRTDITVQIISFDRDKLLRVRRELPHLACFLVIEFAQPPLLEQLAFAVEHGFAGLDTDYQIATPDFSRAVLDAGLQLAHWTVNDVESAKRMIAQGAQFLASDFADAISP